MIVQKQKTPREGEVFVGLLWGNRQQRNRQMNKKMKRIICLGAAGVLALGCAACGSNNQNKESENSSGSGKVEGAADSNGLSFAGDIVGQGGVALDNFVNELEYDFEAMGSKFQIYNDNFTADTQMQNIETMASKGYDGLMIYGWNDTSYASISKTCQIAKAPFAMYDQIPRDDSMVSQLNENEYYIGAVGTDSYACGVNAAKAMLDDGVTKALVLGGAVGDTIHDKRVEGFTKTFEAGGGEVVGAARCTDPSEATQKFDDLVAANIDAEGAYCLSGDYSIAALSALGNHTDANVALYQSDTTKETIPYIKDGSVAYADSGSKIVIPIASALLVNCALGNEIHDENGNAPYFADVVPFSVTAENADQFSDFYLTGHPLTPDQMNKLVGEDVTYQDFVDFIENYSFDTSLK